MRIKNRSKTPRSKSEFRVITLFFNLHEISKGMPEHIEAIMSADYSHSPEIICTGFTEYLINRKKEIIFLSNLQKAKEHYLAARDAEKDRALDTARMNQRKKRIL